MKKTILSLLFLASQPLFAQEAEAPNTKPHIYFDLGKVIVDTEGWENVDYFQGTKEYITDKIEKGYPVKLLVNFVDKLKEETYSNCEEKFAGVVRFLGGVWKGAEPFDWSQYEEIILPPTDEQRKPRPYMFVNALASACPSQAIYLGEDEIDLKNSNFLGLSTWKINASDPTPILPTSQVLDQHIADTFRFSYPEGCAIEMPAKCQLSQDDMQRIITGMTETVPTDDSVSEEDTPLPPTEEETLPEG